MADNTSSKGKGIGKGGGKEKSKTSNYDKLLAQMKPNGQMNNNQCKGNTEERKKLPPISEYKKQATLIFDFQEATQEEIDIVAVSVLKRISIKQSHELRRKNPKKFNYWYRRFWFYTGNWMPKPPRPPSGWFVQCMLTQPAMVDGDWRPKGWFDRFITCPFAGKQWKPIGRILPNLAEITERNKKVVL